MLVPLSSYSPRPKGPKRRVSIFGSTGSIGKSAVTVIKQNPNLFEVIGLAAGSRVAEFVEHVSELRPRVAVLQDPKSADEARKMLAARGLAEIEVLTGNEGLNQLAAHPATELMLAAVVGIAGLEPVLTALQCGINVALANKESLVCGGNLVKEIVRRSPARIIPVDSEHSAIFQVLQGEETRDIRKLILTASGGPFLRATAAELSSVTPEQALKHPTWNMGPKVSIDSATLMNKALELIEAHWLFGLPENQIEVLIHPQSIIHSLVEFVDGSQLSQASVPDMKGAIAYALGYPDGRLAEVMKPLDLASLGSLTFEQLDRKRFPAIDLARFAVNAGSAASAAISIGNEEAVAAFLAGRLEFVKIVPMLEAVAKNFAEVKVTSLSALRDLEKEVREWTARLFQS